MLTGQALEDFEDWWVATRGNDIWTFENAKYTIDDFYGLNFSMQYGIIIDWFDSVNIHINANIWGQKWSYYIKDYRPAFITHFNEHNFNDRATAINSAIIKANNLYNDK